ncbi:hypothetical protein D3C81_874990 [compost metagenome]
MGALGLPQQHRQGGNIQIPLDQGGDGALPAQLPIERPHRRRHRGAVGVDIEVALGQALIGKAGEVDLADGVQADGGQVVGAVEAVIDAADIEVVEIQQDGAATAALQLSQEGPLAHLAGQLQIGRGVLDQQLATQALLHPLYLVAQMAERGPGIGHRQQVVEVTPAYAAPAQMLRDPHRLDGRDQGRQLAQMKGIERVGRAQRHTDPVQADGVVCGEFGQHLEAVAVALEVVFAVHLEPADCGQGLADLVVVGGT